MPRKKAEWSPHRYLVAAARKTWRWSPARTAVLKRVQADKTHWKCEKCLKLVTKVDYVTRSKSKKKRIDGAIDHIIPVGKQPRTWEEYPDYYKRMFCDTSNYQFLCTPCHKVKTDAEKAKRKKTCLK